MVDSKLENLGEEEVEVSPTKDLFVHVLTRDILLDRAVIDLVDNCVDGARSKHPGDGASYEGLWIRVALNGERFEITDNCGGIPIDIARKYAFRFGRSADFEGTPGSIGQFGVGMKRALFKFGNAFQVESKTKTESFDLKVDVIEWLANDSEWRFKFDSVARNLNVPDDETGTRITVTELRPQAKAAFSLESFVSSLRRQIQSAQQHYINRGLSVTVNGERLLPSNWHLLKSVSMDPAKRVFSIATPEGKTVKVQVLAGVGYSVPRDAGWSIFCNGRMVLEADRSDKTGWGTVSGSDRVDLPKYHNQFARFRGYAFMDSDDTSSLPFNTTKTGVDVDSPVYKEVRQHMLEVMRPIVDFLNALDAENDEPDETAKPLQEMLVSAERIGIQHIERVGDFTFQARARGPVAPPQVTVGCKRGRAEADELKEAMSVGTYKRIAEILFDAAYKKYVGEK